MFKNFIRYTLVLITVSLHYAEAIVPKDFPMMDMGNMMNMGNKFVCNENSYLFTSDQRANYTDAYFIDLVSGKATLEKKFGTSHINATGYNVEDDYIYGFEYGNDNPSDPNGSYHIVKIDSKFNIEHFDIENLPKTRFYLGDISMDGIFYLANRHQPSQKANILQEIQRVDLKTKTLLSKITLQYDNNISKIKTSDFAFNPKDNKLYMINANNNQLIRVNPDNGEIDELGYVGNIGNTYSVINFFDGTGNFYFYIKDSQKIYKIDISTPDNIDTKATKFKNINGIINSGDGARCANAAIVDAEEPANTLIDYGDAPKSYGPVWHNIANNIYLGTKIDHDIDPHDTLYADGDDLDGIDDEDGVTLSDGSDINGTYFELGVEQSIKVTLSKEAYLKIWIDKKIKGHFDATDIIYNVGSKLSAGEHTINFTLPAGLQTNKLTYLRARVSSQPSMNPVGFIKDGEVEDYRIGFKHITKGAVGTFNVERTDSYKFPINSDERNAWYTQIVGKDFDYHVVFYNEEMTKEQNLSNVPIKIEVIDQNLSESNNSIAPVHYDYFYNNNPYPSRVFVTAPRYDSDLIETHASRNAIFKISYPLYQDGSVMQFACANNLSRENCYKEAIKQSAGEKSVLARDNFAIRPESYYVLLADQDNILLNSRIENNVSLAAGYEYNLTVIATKQGTDKPSLGYSKPVPSSFELNTTGVNCHDRRPIAQNINFIDGHFQTLSFTHNNVGNYLMKIKDDKLWTAIDQNGSILGCIKDSSERITNNEGKVGCDIVVDKFNTKLLFNPYKFDVNFTTSNLPNSGHSDFIYMSELSKTYHDTSLQFEGNITAQAKDGTITTNFTSSCYAHDISIYPNANLETDRGFITPPKKILTALYDDNISRGEVKLSRMERFNNEDINRSKVSTIGYITDRLSISKDNFLNNQQGAVTLDLRYNIQKTLTQPINPIQITFHSLNVNSTRAVSEANGTSNFIPSGDKNLKEIVRNFYFAQVAPDSIIYPRINMQKTHTVHTPLNVDIFCNAKESYCRKTNVFSNTSLESSPRKQKGWVLSIKHNSANDGGVTALTALLNSNVTPPNTPLSLNSGRNGTLTTTIASCAISSTTITIASDPTLTYYPKGKIPYYTVECTDNNSSEWTGIGMTGNIIDAKANVNRTGKLDW